MGTIGHPHINRGGRMVALYTCWYDLAWNDTSVLPPLPARLTRRSPGGIVKRHVAVHAAPARQAEPIVTHGKDDDED